jgi:hypothetical protein
MWKMGCTGKDGNAIGVTGKESSISVELEKNVMLVAGKEDLTSVRLEKKGTNWCCWKRRFHFGGT